MATPASPDGRDALAAGIAREEARLTELTQERERTQARLDALKAELVSHGVEPAVRVRLAPVPTQPAPATSAGKVALFHSLFRGRDDVYPRLWISNKTGKKGYAPACSNEWVRGVCEKPQVKCGECPNQAFLPFSDHAVLDHLQGRHVMGVYPLLRDETCWFLAVDFDKGAWAEDAAAFRETCRSVGLPAAVERSRSGNGAHVWFFFSAPVPAGTARKMGSYLLTETMQRRHQLGMGSYDRLFPNQDTMPRGGFGNLISLPLQHDPRKKGNTLFVDEGLTPFPDQWSYLASVRRIEPAVVEEVAREASRLGQVMGVRLWGTGDGEEDAAPWLRLPSRRPRKIPILGPLPKEARATLSQKLFVEKTGLPSALLNQIKRLAAFQNPEFYKKQNMRLSTAGTPRVIACAEEFPQHIALPRGCRPEVEAILQGHGSALSVEDQRQQGQPLKSRFKGTLTPMQKQAAKALLGHDTGIFVAPPGTGKTVVGAYLVAKRKVNTLVLVHRRPLLDQWVAQLAMFLGRDPKAIGRIGGGKHRPNGQLDVAMIQSLVKKDGVDDLVAGYGQVIVDECHHLPAVTFERVLAEVKARYLVGLTATPQRRDGHHPVTEMQLGPVRFAVDPKGEAARRPFEHRLIVRETGFRSVLPENRMGIQALYRELAADERRNGLILEDLLRALKEGRSPILLTERRDHLDYFASQMAGKVAHLVVLQGGMKGKERREALARLKTIPKGETRVFLATGRYVGEGFDDARLDTLFLALPVSWKGILVQYAGRLHRLREGKTEVQVYDYVDREVPMLARMFERRLKGYQAIGYAQVEGVSLFSEAAPRPPSGPGGDEEKREKPQESRAPTPPALERVLTTRS